MIKLIVESVSEVSETAKITGIALVPRISRNGNLYTKSEMEKADGVTVPLNWEHDSSKIIGSVTFSYNPALEQLFYEGTVTDEKYSTMVKNKKLFNELKYNVDDYDYEYTSSAKFHHKLTDIDSNVIGGYKIGRNFQDFDKIKDELWEIIKTIEKY